MRVNTIDHVNLLIPKGGVDDALGFYGDTLGFETENLDAYERGERSIFSFRLTPTSVIHIRPDESFKRPDQANFDHYALVVEDSLDEVQETLRNSGVEIIREGNPLGATGRNSAVYVEDPFGYLIELKQAKDSI